MIPKVYIHCCTYNQVNYIRSALDGFVMQKTNFPFEAHINDDASTDGTQEIIKEYAAKYPDIIKPHLRTVNTKGADNYMDSWKRCESPYFANCEGDDYWTDPNKLQMQVDFLEAHPDYSGCFHRHQVLFVEDDRVIHGYPPYPDTIELKHLCERINMIPAASIVYRWRFDRKDHKIEDYFPDGIEPGDWFMHLAHLQCGKFKYINREMCVYRLHKKGIWYGYESGDKAAFEKFWLKRGLYHLKFLVECHKRFGMEIEDRKRNAVRNILVAEKNNPSPEIIKQLYSLYSTEVHQITSEMFDIYSFFKTKTGYRGIRLAHKLYNVYWRLLVGKNRARFKERFYKLKEMYKKLSK